MSKALALSGVPIRRILPLLSPYGPIRQVGPFIFLDEMGPFSAEPSTGANQPGMQVAPHPHINLVTLTYLFEGEVRHQDSLGSDQVLKPGGVNWMFAGRGIVHSERNLNNSPLKMHGMQAWLGLPRELEEGEPHFKHYPAELFQTRHLRTGELGAKLSLTLICGEHEGHKAPVETASPTLMLNARFEAGALFHLPAAYSEQAIFVVSGQLELRSLSGDTGSTPASLKPGELWVLEEGAALELRAKEPAHCLLLGGEPLDGPRFLWWNFASSSPERLEEAKAEWLQFGGEQATSQRFSPIPSDKEEFIPLPTPQADK